MEPKERPFRGDDLGEIRRETYSPSGELPLPWALKKAEELGKGDKIRRFLKKIGVHLGSVQSTPNQPQELDR